MADKLTSLMDHSDAVAFLKKVSDNCKGVTINAIVLTRNNLQKNDYKVRIQAPDVMILYEIIKFARKEGLCAAIDNGGIIIFDVTVESPVECTEEVTGSILTRSDTTVYSRQQKAQLKRLL